MLQRRLVRHCLSLAQAALLAGLLAGCASSGGIDPSAQQQPDRYLFEQGMAALEDHNWLAAREYFRTLFDTYPTSQYRQDAKLGVGDSYLGEERVESDILAAAEFREFLRFFPLAERADYAQYRLAQSQIRQMLRPERDQTATREALREFQTFVTNYPGSEYMPEVLRLQRETRDRLSESELLVGRFYFRQRYYPGTVSRLESLLTDDPQFSKRDEVYYFLAEAYYRMGRQTDARPLFERLVEEYGVSEYLDEARQRLLEIEANPPAEEVPASASVGGN